MCARKEGVGQVGDVGAGKDMSWAVVGAVGGVWDRDRWGRQEGTVWEGTGRRV